MKKLITCLSMLGALSMQPAVFAQCTPDTAQTAFFVPDTATDFQPAFTYMPYEQILNVAIPTQTNVWLDPPGVFVPLTVDTLFFVGVTGLPACISYEPYPTSGNFPGGSYACIRFYGTPAQSDIGEYPFTINAVFDGMVFIIDTVVNAPLDGYKLRILDSSYYGVQHAESRIAFNAYQNAPNPFSGLTEIAFTSPGRENISFEVYDVLGSQVFAETRASVKGMNSLRFDAAGLKPGIYTYRITNGTLTFTRKMIIQGR